MQQKYFATESRLARFKKQGGLRVALFISAGDVKIDAL